MTAVQNQYPLREMTEDEDQSCKTGASVGAQYQRLNENNPMDRAFKVMNVGFDSVFPEAVGAQLPGMVRQVYTVTYKYLVLGVYLVLTFVFGTALMVIFSVTMAVVSFVITWMCSPFMRIMKMCLFMYEGHNRAVMNCAVEPCFAAMGGCCSRVGVRYQQYDQNNIMIV